MELRERILQEHSKKNTDLIIGWIGKRKDRFRELMQLFLNDEYKVVQRCAWIIGICGAETPDRIQAYIPPMLAKCRENGIPIAVKRNVLRCLARLDELPTESHEEAMNLCFDFLGDAKETVAVRCFAMSVLANLSRHYPDIKNALNETLHYILEHEELSPGFLARSRMTLKALKR